MPWILSMKELRSCQLKIFPSGILFWIKETWTVTDTKSFWSFISLKQSSFILRWYNSIHITDSKNFSGTDLWLINTHSQVSGCQINSQRSVALLYTNDKWTEREIRETTPFTTATNSKKYLGGSFTQASFIW